MVLLRRYNNVIAAPGGSMSTVELAHHADNPYLRGVMAPVRTEVTAVDLEVSGQVPEHLHGRYLRNGPNPAAEVDPATYHWFSGDAMVHGLALRDGKALWYRNRWVRTPRYLQPSASAPAGRSTRARELLPRSQYQCVQPRRSDTGAGGGGMSPTTSSPKNSTPWGPATSAAPCTAAIPGTRTATREQANCTRFHTHSHRANRAVLGDRYRAGGPGALWT